MTNLLSIYGDWRQTALNVSRDFKSLGSGKATRFFSNTVYKICGLHGFKRQAGGVAFKSRNIQQGIEDFQQSFGVAARRLDQLVLPIGERAEAFLQ
ncbi:MAG TPA: hypothetical protein VFZ59_17880 [Verrucomicrobiae bacterium]|nr:hypothetical protein [Verrucomicrobiae bacterium]